MVRLSVGKLESWGYSVVILLLLMLVAERAVDLEQGQLSSLHWIYVFDRVGSGRVESRIGSVCQTLCWTQQITIFKA